MRPTTAGLVALAWVVSISCSNAPVRPGDTTPPSATQLSVVSQPATGVAGSPLGPSLTVAIQDAAGTTLTGATTSVTVAITSGTGAIGGVLLGTATQAAVNGIATFPDLVIQRAGSGYRLTATATNLTSATTAAFDIAAAAAARLALSSQPGAVVAGAALAPMQLRVEDAFGNPVTSATSTVTMAITSGTGAAGAVLLGTTTKAAVSGTASFDDLSIQLAGSSYKLTASASGLTGATTNPFAVSPGTPAKLGVVVQPATVIAGAALAPAVQVAVQDAYGNVTASSSAVTMAITSGTGASGAVLGGSVTQAAVNGISSFTTLTIDKPAAGYTLTASASGVTSVTTGAFNVLAGNANRLAILVQPSGVVAGSAITPGVQIAVQDANGNVATSASTSVTIGITAGTGVAGAQLGGTLTRAAVNGVVTFDNLSIDKAAANYSLTVTATGLTNATSGIFAVSPGAATKLEFVQQPVGAVVASIMSPGPRVAIEDAQGNVVTGSSAAVSVAITSGTGSATAVLSGTLSQNAASGVATFGNLQIDQAASGYTFTATSSGLQAATSASFAITQAATQLAFTVQPAAVIAGAVISPSVRVTVQDAQGATVSSATNSITLAITSGSGTAGAVLGGTLTRAAVAGVATFNNVTVDRAGTGYTLTATATGLTTAVSSQFAVAAAATKLAFTVQPSAVVAGAAISPSVQVTVQDAQGATVTTASNSITLAITAGTGTSGAVLGGTVTRAAVNGVATFTNLTVDKAGTGYTLTATATNLSAATSTSFAVTITATKLAFTVQPSAAAVGAVVSPAVQVTIQNAQGVTVTTATNSVTLAITSGSGTAGAILGGTLTKAAVNGVATFNNLTIDRAGTGYTLDATATGLTSATSSAFTVSAATGGTLLFQEDFEDTNLGSRGWYDNTNVLLSTTEHISGNSSSEYRFAAGASTPSIGPAQRHKFTPSTSFYVSFYVKYSANWVGSNHDYHPHEFYAMTNLDSDFEGPSNAWMTVYIEHNYQNGGIPRLAMQDNKSINTSSGPLPNNLVGTTENRSTAGCNGLSEANMSMECFFFDTFWFNDKWLFGPVVFKPSAGPGYKNNWNFVEAYFQLNTIVSGIGQPNGVMQYWFNGALVIDRHDIMFRTGTHPTMQFNQFLIAPYIGDGSPVAQSMFIDNLRLATARIP